VAGRQGGTERLAALSGGVVATSDQQHPDRIPRRPPIGILPTQADQLQSKLDTLRQTTTSAARLTTAELRLLPLLSTHLTFREMSERLYLSPHTVKSQALSVYRKLGVSSRAQAILRVQQTGLPGM
jgi:LuxR family maltose regulon positive regulatory protein